MSKIQAVVMSDSAHDGKDFVKLAASVQAAETWLRENKGCTQEECWSGDSDGKRTYYLDDWGYIIYPVPMS